jgi:UDP-N-acetyl-D-galactosamine dehydrogenase
MSIPKEHKIALLGLGYVGLPLAVAFAEHYDVLGFDTNAEKAHRIASGIDTTNELEGDQLSHALTTRLRISSNPAEEVCVPILEQPSGLTYNLDFTVGYSPERINPGDKQRNVTNILKVTSGSTKEAAKEVDALYNSIITAGTHLAPSIKVAEAAKAIENAQRDVNISFINELALIFEKLDIDTGDVLAAAGTKWNFLPFKPGLVGGHCISVDPYYLAHKAQEVGHDPQVILSGRRINDGMGLHVASSIVKLLHQKTFR